MMQGKKQKKFFKILILIAGIGLLLTTFLPIFSVILR